MSNIKKYEQVLRYITNEETEKAEELMHEIFVESGRDIWSQIVKEDEHDEMGGDTLEDFMSDVESNEEDIENDELSDGEVEPGEESEDDEERDDKIEDIESQLAELTAKFEDLLQDEMKEPYHDPEDFGMDSADVEDMEGEDPNTVEEATEFSKNVDVKMDKEGVYAGTGDKSDKAVVNSKSPYSTAQRKEQDSAGKGPVEFGKGGDEKGMKADMPKDETPYDNMDDEGHEVKTDDQTDDGDYIGTGKNSPKGKVGSQSPLSKKPE